MNINLTEVISKNLGYAPLKKIDPNTEDLKIMNNDEQVNKLEQAAVPSVLIAMYKYTRSDEGAEKILCGDNSTNWLNELLPDAKNEVVNNVAAYADCTGDEAKKTMKAVADETVKVIRDANQLSVNDVKNLLGSEKNTILLYLPPALHIGEVIHDNLVDDNTHKMEGPISSVMNALGNIFSESEKEEMPKK